MEEKCCKNCQLAFIAGYKQVICKKTNRFEVERYSCKYWRERKDERTEECAINRFVIGSYMLCNGKRDVNETLDDACDGCQYYFPGVPLK